MNYAAASPEVNELFGLNTSPFTGDMNTSIVSPGLTARAGKTSEVFYPLFRFSASLNLTILRINSYGRGWSSGNCTAPLEVL